MKIIKDNMIVEDGWDVLIPEEGVVAEALTLPEGKVLVPLKTWLAQREALLARGGVGVWLASDERAEALQPDLARIPVIGINFPKFTDGRGYTLAYRLRRQMGYQGELRAIGDVMRDQLFYMQRAGFDAFAVKPGKDIGDALNGLKDFSVTYQAAADVKAPLFRREQRGEAR